MAQTLDESRAQLIADLQERAEELTQLNRIFFGLAFVSFEAQEGAHVGLFMEVIH